MVQLRGSGLVGLGEWFKRCFRNSGKPAETVAFFDVEIGRVVHIPASELRPGAVQAQVQGIDGLVWLAVILSVPRIINQALWATAHLNVYHRGACVPRGPFTTLEARRPDHIPS
jgi:hypothetical protein